MTRGLRGVAVGALSLLAAACWPVPGQNADRTGYNDLETGLTTETVGGLEEQWRWTGSSGMSGPVVSPGGVHVVHRCQATTLDPATGAISWEAPLLADMSLCDAGLTVQRSEPYTTSDSERVVASVGVSRVRPPGYLEAEWTTRALDATTGAQDGLAPVGFVAAERGTQLAGVTEGPVGPYVAETVVRLARSDTGAAERSFRVAVRPSQTPAPPGLTLGTDRVFHAGNGILATEPGAGAQGDAVRAFSLNEPRDGCGPVTFPGTPVPGSYEVECPLWVTPTDGRPTAPVLGPDGSALYVRTTAGTLYALDAGTGEVLWTATGLGAAGAPALAQGKLYVPTGDGRVVTFDAGGCGQPACQPTSTYATGTTAAAATPAVAGTVLYTTAGGSAHAFAAGGCPSSPCSPLWSGPGAGSPVVSNGQLYVRSPAGTELVAYGLD